MTRLWVISNKLKETEAKNKKQQQQQQRHVINFDI